nr:MAG TPA: hypothetical protein [Bacteriophage sp.]
MQHLAVTVVVIASESTILEHYQVLLHGLICIASSFCQDLLCEFVPHSAI